MVEARATILNSILRLIAALGWLFVIVSGLSGTRAWLGLMGYVLPALTVISAMALVRGWYRLRSIVLVVCLTAVGLGGLIRVGPLPGNYLITAAAVVLAAILLGRTSAFVALGFDVVVSSAIGIAYEAGMFHSSAPETFDPSRSANWLRFAVSFTISVTIMTTVLLYLLGALERRVIEEQHLNEKLEASQLRSAELEQERLKLLKAAQDAQRLDALGRMAGGVAHDLGNQLAVVFTSLDLMRRARNPAECHEELAALESAAHASRVMASQLLAVARRTGEEPSRVALPAAIESAMPIVTRLVPGNIRITLGLASSGVVEVARGEIERILFNLISNARDAMPDGGTLSIETRRIDSAHTPNEAQRRDCDHVEIVVSDTGIGMDAATVARVFEPFFSTKGSRGTGLGLASVQGIASQRGGYVIASSELGRGASFRVGIPLAGASDVVQNVVVSTAKPSAADSAAPSSPVAVKASATVLIIDDDEMVARSTARLFERIGYKTLLVSSGDAAREVLFSDSGPPPHVDMICTDARMPGLPVVDLLAEIRGRHPSLPIVVYSGYVDSDLLARRATLAFAFLGKPFTVQELEAKVTEAHAMSLPGRLSS